MMLTWKMMFGFGISLVVIIGCGGNDYPLKEEMPDPSTETSETQFRPVTNITPILGTWVLKSIATFHGDEVVRQESAVFAIYLTFKPDRTFESTYSRPIKEVTNAATLAEKGLQHILQHTNDITVTVQGEFEIGINQIRLTFLSASVTPKEAPEIDSDFENPMFFPFIEKVGDSRMLYYTIAEDSSEIVFVAKEGKLSADVIYQRLKTD